MGKHTTLWNLFGDSRLSRQASSFISKAADGRRKIAVSAITLAEVVCLAERNKAAMSAYDELAAVLIDSKHVFSEAGKFNRGEETE